MSKCIICGEVRSKEDTKNINSHVIPRSVLLASKNTHSINAATGKEVGHSNNTFNGFCKECEKALNDHGEVEFNPKLHKPLVDGNQVTVTVPSELQKLFHCCVSICWRYISLSEHVSNYVIRDWLPKLRPMIRNGYNATYKKFVTVYLIVFDNATRDKFSKEKNQDIATYYMCLHPLVINCKLLLAGFLWAL